VGHQVVCACRAVSLEHYQDLRRRRLEGLAQTPGIEWRWGLSFGDEAFVQLAGEGPWDLLAHHAAQVGDYKSPAFDVNGALAANTRNLREVLAAMTAAGSRRVLLSGSIFEPDEGAPSPTPRAFSPYGLSKGLTYQVYRYHAEMAGMALGKFVIPNPFGPLEEPRFTAHLMRTWREGKVVEVKTPDYVRDNIHVNLLAQAYRTCAEKLVAGSASVMRFNPSGYAGSQGAFTELYAREMRLRLGWPCELALATQTDFAEPLERVNTEPATQWAANWDEGNAWDGVAEYYRNGVA